MADENEIHSTDVSVIAGTEGAAERRAAPAPRSTFPIAAPAKPAEQQQAAAGGGSEVEPIPTQPPPPPPSAAKTAIVVKPSPSASKQQPSPQPRRPGPLDTVPVPPWRGRPPGRPPAQPQDAPPGSPVLAHNITVCGRDLVKCNARIYSRVLSALDDDYILSQILQFKNLTAIAKALECSRGALQRYVELVPMLRDAYMNAKDSIDDLAEQKLFEKIQAGDLGALMFYMPRRMRHRGYGDDPQANIVDEQPRVIIGRIPDAEVKAAKAKLPPPPKTLQKAQVAQLHPRGQHAGEGDGDDVVDVESEAVEPAKPAPDATRLEPAKASPSVPEQEPETEQEDADMDDGGVVGFGGDFYGGMGDYFESE